MKIVIDINEKDYKFIKSVRCIAKNGDAFQRIAADLFNAVQEGTPLPKGHGELIDNEVVLDMMNHGILEEYITDMSGVIPADG